MACVIFDLDGTLLYTLEDLYLSTNYALNELSFPARSLNEVRTFVGNGVRKLIERALPAGCDEKTINRCLEIFKDYYSKNSNTHTRPYEGVLEVLNYLKNNNIKAAVNSNKYDAAVKKLCKRYFDDLISLSLGEGPNCARKPSPEGVYKILETLNCKKDKALYVGDSLTDIQTAKNAGIKCISVSWGYCDKDTLKSHNHIVADNAKELLDEIKKTFNNITKC